MSVFESIERYPVEYLPTGDKALIMAWAILNDPKNTAHLVLAAVLCLEDGTVKFADRTEFKFDYRYDVPRQRWVDVSTIPEGNDDDADTDQAAEDDGGPPVP